MPFKKSVRHINLGIVGWTRDLFTLKHFFNFLKTKVTKIEFKVIIKQQRH